MANRRIKVDGVGAIFVNEGSGGATQYADRASFPAPPAAGDSTQLFAIAKDTGGLYCSFGGIWCFITILAAP